MSPSPHSLKKPCDPARKEARRELRPDGSDAVPGARNDDGPPGLVALDPCAGDFGGGRDARAEETRILQACGLRKLAFGRSRAEGRDRHPMRLGLVMQTLRQG